MVLTQEVAQANVMIGNVYGVFPTCDKYNNITFMTNCDLYVCLQLCVYFVTCFTLDES